MAMGKRSSLSQTRALYFFTLSVCEVRVCVRVRVHVRVCVCIPACLCLLLVIEIEPKALYQTTEQHLPAFLLIIFLRQSLK